MKSESYGAGSIREILAEIFGVGLSEVDEMIRAGLKQRIGALEEKDCGLSSSG
jgi:hypothetical protein